MQQLNGIPDDIRSHNFIQSHMAKIANLKIYGDIGEPMVDMFFGIMDENTVSAKTVATFLEENADADEINVRINSRGGDVQEGWTIHDLLVNSGKKIKTIGEGKIYSIATIIFLAGTEREIFANADGLIHNPYIPPYTLADKYESGDLAKIAEQLAQEEEKILNFYAEKTGADRAKLADYMKNETKLSADDMLALGFATKVIQPIKAFAIYKPFTHKNNNNMATDAEKMKIMERFDAIMAGDFAKAFSRTGDGIKNLEFTATDGKKFTIEKESGDPAVGDVAKPDGTYVMENGDTVVVSGGKVESVTPKSQTNPELDAANAKITELSAELDRLKGEKAAADAELVEFRAKKTEFVNLVNELSGMKNSWTPGARSKVGDGTKTVDGIDMDGVDKAKAALKTK